MQMSGRFEKIRFVSDLRSPGWLEEDLTNTLEKSRLLRRDVQGCANGDMRAKKKTSAEIGYIGPVAAAGDSSLMTAIFGPTDKSI